MSSKFDRFFSKTVKGDNRPSEQVEPTIVLNNQNIQFYYKMFTGAFTKHINASIPHKIDADLATVGAIQATFRSARILDIGAGDGTFGKTLSYLNNTYDVTCIDPNPDMAEALANGISMDNFHPLRESFYSECCNAPIHNLCGSYDVVRESMVFQFITPDRKDFIREVKKMLNKDGVFITEEKFLNECQATYDTNEALKDEFKEMYFDSDSIDKKSKDVLSSMVENQMEYNGYTKLLMSNFRYVGLYYRAGNFRGLIATNSSERYKSMMNSYTEHHVLKYNNFNVLEMPNLRRRISKYCPTKRYNDAVKNHPRFSLEIAVPKQIAVTFESVNRCFCAVSNDGELKHLFKPDHAIFDDIVRAAERIRREFITSSGISDAITVEVFDIDHNLIDKYVSMGYKVTKNVKFSPDFASDKIKNDKHLMSLRPDIVTLKRKNND
jgi:SAM-dependent methyltransferase